MASFLNEFVATSGYHRKHASALLTGKRQWRDLQLCIRRARRRFYTAEDQGTVLRLAELFDDIGSKRLRAAMNTELANVRRNGYLKVSRQGYQHLCKSVLRCWSTIRRSVGYSRCDTRRPVAQLNAFYKVRRFYEANKKVVGDNPDLIQPGMELVIPMDGV